MSDSYKEEWLTGPHQTSFYTRLYRPPPESALSGVLVFVHGYDEHISRPDYERMHAAWAARGFALFAWDLRGFGRTALDAAKSPGSSYGQMEEVLGDLEWALQHTRSLFPRPTPLFLMGHSMGGGIVLEYILSKAEVGHRISGVISSSPWITLTNSPPTPALWILGLIGKFFPHMHFSTPTRPKAISHDLSIGEALIADPWVRQYGTFGSILERLAVGKHLLKEGYKHWPKTLPLLLLHGTDDDMNSCAGTETFFKGLQVDDARLVLYPGAFHDLMTEPDVKEQYQRDCMSWVEERLNGSRGDSVQK
ncbi:lysophospholipase [Roridomyces roridus]|uniref:Lysophospholipase n=1 Tax=Roridomyces roridus TaxID=1738132 RepID=A0AAD7G3E4_9AGAR|nr:lysophospholipase [Roridomyces roridus]